MVTATKHTFLGKQISALTRRRINAFKAHKRGYWSFWLLLIILLFTLFAEAICNDKPILVVHDGDVMFPIFKQYSESELGGELETEADFRDPYVRELIDKDGWALWPPIPFSYQTVDWELNVPVPSAPDSRHWLGTDDQARDVLARVIYGFRVSVLFGFILTIISAVIGVLAGAAQGYFGGWLDLLAQRFIEVWGSLPTLFILIILGSIFEPNFWWLLGFLLLFTWMGFVGVVRAEFLRARNFDYVRAARALGVSDVKIMLKHVLPNALVATMTFMPFTLASSVTVLTALDFLGVGLPPGSASLGELLAQGKANMQAPWLMTTGFFVIATLLTLLIFIAEGVRDAFDPRTVTAPDAESTETLEVTGQNLAGAEQ